MKWLLVTRDFVPPSGSWFFPLNRVGLLQQPSLQFPKIPPVPPASLDEAADDADAGPSRHRSITKRRREQYGGTSAYC